MFSEVLSYLDLKVVLPVIRLLQIVIVDGQSFDFVVVGAGSAGCVLAHRLTEANWTVLLVEAGDDPPSVTKNPMLSISVLPSLPDWNYYSIDDGYSSQARRSKNVHHISGKMVGGSSSVNYMYHVRGNKADYDGWGELNTGWDWTNVERYFRKTESYHGSVKDSPRGFHGPIGVTRQEWKHRTDAYFNAFKENGHTILDDFNSDQQNGYSSGQFSIAGGTRQSTAVAYLKPIRDRPNFFLLKNALAQRVIFDNDKRAVGVEIKLPDAEVIRVNVMKEIILSAGAVNSPQLLMLSGVGPKDHLEEMGIEVVFDSENVGENLQDHMMVHVMLTGVTGISSVIQSANSLFNWDKFPVPTLIGFASLNKSENYPDYQATVCPLGASHLMVLLACKQMFELDDRACLKLIAAGKGKETLNALISLLHPESRGSIKLKSRDPEASPYIYNGYFSIENDLEHFARYVEDFVSVANTSSLRTFGSEVVYIELEQCMNFELGSHEYWKCYVLNTAGSHYHLAGTCAMGPEGEGVVDERLRVRGVGGLRVVDASVMPKITTGNTNAPVMMIAEKASDMIKVDHGFTGKLGAIAM